MTARSLVTGVAGAAVAVAGLLLPAVAPATAGPTAAHHAGTAAQVHQARAATRTFTRPRAAKRAGYALLKDAHNVACISMAGMGGMGVHYANGALVDSRIQVRHPEALVYRFTVNGHLKLAALEYLVLRKDWRAAHGAHAARPELFGHRFDLTKAGNRFGLPAYYSLHAWVWQHNPAGEFRMWNPRVHCPAGI